MEKKFYTDDFERLLKEKSDEFRMYPSKRVWHSIYNDLHPGRKWPSIAMSMFLVISLLLIGSLNTNDNSVNINKQVTAVSALKPVTDQNGNTTTPHLSSTGSSDQPADLTPTTDNGSSAALTNNHTQTAEDLLKGDRGNAAVVSGNQSNEFNGNNNPVNTAAATNQVIESMDTYIKTNQLFADINEINKQKDSKAANGLSPGLAKAENITGSNPASAQIRGTQLPAEKAINIPDENKAAAINEVLSPKSNNAGSAVLSKKPESTEDKAWMEDYALHNKGQRKKWKDRVAMELYVTPSVGYRTQNSNIKNEAAAASYTSGNTTVNKSVSQKPSLNLEAGVDLAYSFAKNLRLKTGVQLNYTSYGINADQTNHPILTTLMLNDPYSGRPYLTTRTSTLANSSGLQSVTVHNTTYQLSIPVGLAIKLAGNNKMEWHVGASIQPSFIFGGTTNFISSDYRSYVSDPTLLRRWNMNTGIETYLNYKLNGYTLQVGPQFRYQLLSTYTKKYTVNENLYNMGLKVGLVKNF